MSDRQRVSRMGAPVQRVYDALLELEERYDGWTIPIEIVTRRVGLASRSTTQSHLRALARAGVVEVSPFPKGGYRVKRRRDGHGEVEG